MAIRGFALLVIALAALAVAGSGLSASPAASAIAAQPAPQGSAKVHPWVLADTASGQAAPVIVLLVEQGDLRAARTMRDPVARGWQAYDGLRGVAARSQVGVRASLDAWGVPYRAYWAANAVALTADRALVEALAARPDVRVIESDRPVRGIVPPPGASPVADPRAPSGVEWGVANVNAPAVWAQGATGQGIVVASADTGVQWDHPALRAHYRGWNGATADHNYQWWDAIHDAVGNPCPNSSQAPCDDGGHGTHTTGTLIGDDGLGNQIGVAPSAKWIGCRNMDRGFGTPSRYVECFQFFLAPTDLSGQNPDPSRRPHVINNSWTCPTSEGCPSQALQIAVENLEAAGIFAAMAAGNSGGAGCGSVSEPPSIYGASFSVGAYDASNSLAGFSSRGPVLVDGSNRLKPDLAAPGVNVRSAYPTNTYSSSQGTSMATPHVAGVVALLWSARPELARDVAATRALLLRTANPSVAVNPPQTCGGVSSATIPNVAFGYGRVDALAAVNAAGAAPTATPTRAVPTFTPTAIPASATPTRTPTPSPTATPPACVPRPAVVVASAPDGGGRLRATVSAASGPGAPSNGLVRLEFGTLANAVLDVPGMGAGLAGSVTVPLAPGTQQATFYVRRITAGQATTANLVVVDACGGWPTFVGGGPTAF